MKTQSSVPHSPVRKNIQSIIKLEEEAFHSLSPGERISNAIAHFAGKVSFVVYHIIWFALWILWNTFLGRGLSFDPFPFTLLTTLVSLEAIFLSIFLLINQNVMNRQSDHRAHLDLQVNLLAEQEATQMLRMVRRLCQRLDVKVDDLYEELDEMERQTDVHAVLAELKEQLPSDSNHP